MPDEAHDVLVVPEEERTLGDLEVVAHDGALDHIEEWHEQVVELLGLRQLQDLLQLAQEEHLLLRVGLRPEAQERLEHGRRERWVLLHELGDAVGERLVVECHALRLVHRQERVLEELHMFVLQGEREPVDDRPEDLQKLCDPVVALRLVDEAEECVVDRPADVWAVRHELPIDPVQDRLEVVPLARVLALEEVHDVCHELNVEVLLRHLGLRLPRHNEPQEELVDHLQVRPGWLQDEILVVLLGPVPARTRREGPEQVVRQHEDDVRIRLERGGGAQGGVGGSDSEPEPRSIKGSPQAARGVGG